MKYFFLAFVKAKSCKNSLKFIGLSLSHSMHRMLSADNLSWDMVDLSSFMMLLSLEKDLSRKQLVTIMLGKSLNIASTLGKAV